MSSKEKRFRLLVRLIGRFFTLKWENSRKESTLGKIYKPMKNEDENFLFI